MVHYIFFLFFHLITMYIGYDVIHAIRAGSVHVTERSCSERKRKSSVTYHQQAQSRVRVKSRSTLCFSELCKRKHFFHSPIGLFINILNLTT